ncbi:thiamine phosphate synthase [Natronorubrum thiooxidans]|uniref:Thiamine-phosphate synthase n=1 Tax=Natronorubrum thiooxidans TaxID=308853 RepID=A0A1N7GRE1_9EURY|nr:thiamine phosphate synthase [Natronorubrum thiooxidans]SIS15100.1 thiamine-phosphate diphosphorylase [Natronorubrum thiooxidans]
MPPTEYGTYLVTQASLSAGRETTEIVRTAIDGGIDAVQLREKGTDARWRYDLGLEVRELTAEAGVDLLVNDRVDIAQAIDADGVHLGQSDLPVAVARDLLGPEAVLGCSASTVDEATQAEADGADYLGIGSIYGTTSKDVEADRASVGPERIAEISTAVSIPFVGIGGITAGNAGPVVEAGAAGVAVVSEITAAEDPRTATESLVSAVETAKGMGDTPPHDD